MESALYRRVAARLDAVDRAALDALLVRAEGATTTPFNRLKQTPGPPTHRTLRRWIERLDRLDALPDDERPFEGIAHTKLRQFAAEAAAMEVDGLLDVTRVARRHTLLLALVRQARTATRDELVEMLLRRVRRTRVAAREALEALRAEHRRLEETLIGVLGEVAEQAEAPLDDAALGASVRAILAAQGGAETVGERVRAVSAYHADNDLPLLWPIHRRHRALLFRILDRLEIRPTTQDGTLLAAWREVSARRDARRRDVPVALDLGFASQRWQDFVAPTVGGAVVVDRRALEVCVFVHLADALLGGDICVLGSERFADYRAQLLPWSACAPRVAAYCEAVGLPAEGAEAVDRLKADLTAIAAAVDAGFPGNGALSLDPDGTPHLRQLPKAVPPEGLAAFEAALRARMPERHLLDILKRAEHWSRFTRHFSPPSRANPKLARPVPRYLFTVFGYGCNLGPAQTARHAPDLISAQAMRRINAQHIDAGRLEKAMVDLIGAYARFPLPRHWGPGRAAIADGTHAPLRENNLLGSRHIRYGGYGAIAYHHIADSYVALFTTAIPCGVWEAVHILDGLLKNGSCLQPDTLHADTQGQSTPVFGLSRLLGIELMPRMRGLGDAVFHRPDRAVRYQHIDALFGAEIDWALIATHWRDMLQVVLSIQAGSVMPSMLLRKLGSFNRQNRLYRAFRELGRVQRTAFLLRYLGDIDLRRSIRAETTKIETFNDFLDWIGFGGPVIRSGDPVEQEKSLKYASVVANAIMLSNVVDMSAALAAMAEAGETVTPELVAALSPYGREHIRRFGQYVLDMTDLPGPLDPRPLPFAKAL
jgi:TnpA family transposase